MHSLPAMDIAYGRIMPTVPADRQPSIKPQLPDYLLKPSFDSVVSGDQEYGYRIVVWINYPYRVVYIRFIGTHRQYDAIDAQSI